MLVARKTPTIFHNRCPWAHLRWALPAAALLLAVPAPPARSAVSLRLPEKIAAAGIFGGWRKPQTVIPLWPHSKIPLRQRHVHIGNRRGGGYDIVFPNHWATLTFYPAPAKHNSGAAIILCPGGGYVAEGGMPNGPGLWVKYLGLNWFVLVYRLPNGKLPPSGVPWPLQDVRRAVQIVRAHAAQWRINPRRVGLMGFSAGGGLASLAAVHWRPGNPAAPDPLDRFSTRPNFIILGAPLISMMPAITDPNPLVGPHAPLDVDQYFSSELNVTPLTSPALIFYARNDTLVKHQNEQLFYAALRRNGVPAKLVVFQHGGHGLAGVAAAPLIEHCAAWLNQLGFLGGGK